MNGPDADRPEEPAAKSPDAGATEGNAEAEQAAGALKDQIAAIRARVRDAQETLRKHARNREPRSFKR